MRKMMESKLKNKGGFTLIEMLIVVAIIAILAAVSIPLVTTSLDKAKKATDDANLRAAKAAAVIEKIGNNKEVNDKWYDVETGTVTDNKPNAYGKAKDNTKNAVKITTDASGNIAVQWVDTTS